MIQNRSHRVRRSDDARVDASCFSQLWEHFLQHTPHPKHFLAGSIAHDKAFERPRSSTLDILFIYLFISINSIGAQVESSSSQSAFVRKLTQRLQCDSYVPICVLPRLF